MKKFFFAAFALLTLLLVQAPAQAQNKKQETVEGNGKLVTRTVAVQPFTVLKASGIYELKLTQGATEGIKIEADENLQDYFTVSSEGNKLVIDTKKLNGKNLQTKNKMRVYVTFKNLKELELSTVGNIASESRLTFDEVAVKSHSVGNINLDLTARQLNLENSSVGDVKLKGSAQNAVMKNNGVGSLHAGDFVVQTLDIDNTGVGSAEVNAEKGLKVNDSFLGKVKNRGAAQARKKRVAI